MAAKPAPLRSAAVDASTCARQSRHTIRELARGAVSTTRAMGITHHVAPFVFPLPHADLILRLIDTPAHEALGVVRAVLHAVDAFALMYPTVADVNVVCDLEDPHLLDAVGDERRGEGGRVEDLARRALLVVSTLRDPGADYDARTVLLERGIGFETIDVGRRFGWRLIAIERMVTEPRGLEMVALQAEIGLWDAEVPSEITHARTNFERRATRNAIGDPLHELAGDELVARPQDAPRLQPRQAKGEELGGRHETQAAVGRKQRSIELLELAGRKPIEQSRAGWHRGDFHCTNSPAPCFADT